MVRRFPKVQYLLFFIGPSHTPMKSYMNIGPKRLALGQLLGVLAPKKPWDQVIYSFRKLDYHYSEDPGYVSS